MSLIAAKLRVHISAIGTIYYFDQYRAQIIVDETTIRSLPHEQDLVVQLSWVGNPSPGCDAEAHALGPCAYGVHDYPREVYLTKPGENENEQHISCGPLNVFDDYLGTQSEDSYVASDYSRSEYTDDTSISMSQMFARCSTAQTTISSDDGMFFGEDSFHQQLVLGNSRIEHTGYPFDAFSTLAPHLQYLPSLPRSEVTQLLTIGNTPAIEHPIDPVEKLPATRALLEGCTPPVSRNYTAQQRRTRKHKPPTFLKTATSDIESPKSRPDKDFDALERNRVAAMKCRTTRKEREARLYAQSQEKMKLNGDLKKEIEQLEAEVLKLRELWQEHLGCL